MKKILFSFILILLCLLSVTVCAEREIFSYSFETEKEQDSWYGTFFDKSLAFGNGYSAFVTNPFGEVKNDTVTHVIDYTGKIHLDAGKIYTLSGYVMNPLKDYNGAVRTSANLGNSANTIIVTVSGADSEWDRFTTTFYSGVTGEFNLSVYFTEGNVDFGFFIDELHFEESSYILAEIGVDGPDEILIPFSSSTTVRFSPYLTATDSTQISILSSGNIVSSCSHASGVSYNPNEFTLTVTGDATPSTQLTLDFALTNYKDLSLFSHTVTLTDNIIKDSSLDGDNLLWTSSSVIKKEQSDANTYISLPTNDYGDFGYFSTLTYDASQLLVEGEMYVIRARVKSDVKNPVSTIYAKNFAYSVDNTVFFNINNIPAGEWSEVFAAFVPETSGIYNISLNLCSIYDCMVYIDDIRLATEASKPEYLTLHAPGNIAVPDVLATYPVSALLRDQMGNVIDTDDIVISLICDNSSLEFDADANTVTVFPDTLSGEYILTAQYIHNPSLTASLPITVSLDYIGDGGFEEKEPNEWWMVTSPYNFDFYIRNDGTSKRALINSLGDFFILLNNSYVSLIKNTPYVFNGNFSCATDCTVTLFLESLDSEIHPLAQFHLPKGTTLSEKLPPSLFLAEENMTGRILLYVQSDNMHSFSLYADNLSLKKAFIMASNLHIEGSASVNSAVEAQFSFYNSVAQDGDTSSCIVNWYVSSNPSSGFTMLETLGKSIYFDTTFLNKYVYFEIIPVCPMTGFSGETSRSPVFKITYEDNYSSDGGPFYLPVLRNSDKTEYFEDTSSHWAGDTVNLLASNGIINGKSKKRFAPDDAITRAEFAKLISTAFSVKSEYDFSQFGDIKKTDWFYRHVCALNLYGIINGTSSSKFSPDQNIRREDAVVMLMRVYENMSNKNLISADTSFSDNADISGYALGAVATAQKAGIVQGNGKGSFKPTSYITRAEAAVLLYRTITALKI